MKKFIYFIMLILIVVSCKKETPKKIFDPDAMIVLRGQNSLAKSPAQRAMVSGLTDLEIVKNGVNIKWKSHWAGNDYYEEPKEIARGFGDHQKDFEKPALLMFGADIVAYDGVGNYFYKDFIYGYDVYITDNNNDTIAYVPNKVIEDARKPIEEAWNRGDYDAVYKMFNEAFTFLPMQK